MDNQIVEILGRNYLTSELLRAGLEVAVPARDRGIDLIAYADLETAVDNFVARPIQMKAASSQGFNIYQKYAKFPDLILAYVWHLAVPKQEVTYALTYREAIAIAEKMGWTGTNSWARGGYATSRPSTQLQELLAPFQMTPEKWWSKVTGMTS